MGAGRWGTNVIRTLGGLPEVELAWIADPDPYARERAAALSPRSRLVESVDRALDDVHAVVICTPAVEHLEHASEIIGAGLHALVEKPLATSAAGALGLAERAADAGLTLMVGHQLLFHPLFCELERLVGAGGLGQLREIRTERTGPIDFSSEPDVLWAYGPHDVSMVVALAGASPVWSRCTGSRGAPSGAVGEAAIDFRFPSGLAARIDLDGVSPSRRRRLTVVGERGVAVFADEEPGGRLTVETRDQRFEIEPDAGRAQEPLRRSCGHFVQCVLSGARPRTCGRHGQRVAALIERAAAEMAESVRAVRHLAEERPHRRQTI